MPPVSLKRKQVTCLAFKLHTSTTYAPQSFHSQSNSKHSKKQGSEDTSSSDGAESVSDYEGIDSSEGNVTAGKVSKKEEGLAKQLVQRSRKSVDMMRHVLHLGGETIQFMSHLFCDFLIDMRCVSV